MTQSERQKARKRKRRERGGKEGKEGERERKGRKKGKTRAVHSRRMLMMEGRNYSDLPRPAPTGEEGVNFTSRLKQNLQAPCSSLDSVAWQPHKHLPTIQPCKTSAVLK